jgi:sugar (pentulose or hexulose) kinase
MREVFLGIDCATQSSRSVLIDGDGAIYARHTIDLAPVQRGSDGRLTQDPQSWLSAVDGHFAYALNQAKEQQLHISGASISATSGTFVLADKDGKPVAPAAMYNDGRAANPLARAEKTIEEVGAGAYLFAHTPEYVVAHITGHPLHAVATDWSHAMKTGVDLHSQGWSAGALETATHNGITLPKVVAPGTLLGKSIVGDIPIYAGMTDGCTAQISVGATSIGSAVSTLGTTLVLKVVGVNEIAGPGFYSHLLPAERWLGGAASNLGGISFEKYQSDIKSWDQKAAAHGPASFVIYPLVGAGERFPIANKDMKCVATGSALNEADEYRAILEGIAFAERYSYEILEGAGAQISGAIYSAGGGSRSAIWSAIRATVMHRPIATVKDSGSDLGAAKIAAAAHAVTNQGVEDLASELDKFNSSTIEVIEPNKLEEEILENRYQEFLTLVKPFQTAGIR